MAVAQLIDETDRWQLWSLTPVEIQHWIDGDSIEQLGPVDRAPLYHLEINFVQPQTCVTLLVIRKSDTLCVGHVRVDKVGEQMLELRWLTAQSAQNQHYASEAVRASGSWLCRRYPLASLEAQIDPQHQTSQLVARAAGFHNTEPNGWWWKRNCSEPPRSTGANSPSICRSRSNTP